MLKKGVEGGYLGPAYFQPNQTRPVFQKDQSASLPIGDPTVGVTPSPQFNATAPDSSSCWGGGPKTCWNPRTQEFRNWITSKVTRAAKGEETRNLRKPV
jgi:hypothetical protein